MRNQRHRRNGPEQFDGDHRQPRGDARQAEPQADGQPEAAADDDPARRRAQGLAALRGDGAVGQRRPDGNGNVAGTGQSVAAGAVHPHDHFRGDEQRQRHRPAAPAYLHCSISWMKPNSRWRRRRKSAFSRVESWSRGRAKGTSISCARRPGFDCKRDHPVAEVDRLFEIVGDEHDGDAGGGDEARHLVLQAMPGHGVERAERLVHQEDRRLLRQAARDLQALLHAAGELRRVSLGVGGEADRAQQLADAGSALPLRHADRLQRQRHVAGDGAPGQQRACRSPGTRPRPRARGLSPPPLRAGPSRTSARRSPVTMRSSVVLPHPDGPTTQTNCPRGTLKDSCSMIRRPPRSRSTRSKAMAGSAGCGFPRTLSGRSGCTPRP